MIHQYYCWVIYTIWLPPLHSLILGYSLRFYAWSCSLFISLSFLLYPFMCFNMSSRHWWLFNQPWLFPVLHFWPLVNHLFWLSAYLLRFSTHNLLLTYSDTRSTVLHWSSTFQIHIQYTHSFRCLLRTLIFPVTYARICILSGPLSLSFIFIISKKFSNLDDFIFSDFSRIHLLSYLVLKPSSGLCHQLFDHHNTLF